MTADTIQAKQLNITVHPNSMVLIPEGDFMMGAEGWGDFEKPIHSVYVKGFYMDCCNVTNEEFEKFISNTGYKTTAEIRGGAQGYRNGLLQEIPQLNWRNYYNPDRKLHPVVLVSWHDAKAYATWAGKRLPTEAEWEKAARGGLENKLYPWGDDIPDASKCNFGKTTSDFPATSSVTDYSPNGFGLYDMCGNVWNWCNDNFVPAQYAIAERSNPTGPSFGQTKIRRGGSFNIMQTFRLRVANRGAFDPDNYSINIGFRCVKDI